MGLQARREGLLSQAERLCELRSDAICVDGVQASWRAVALELEVPPLMPTCPRVTVDVHHERIFESPLTRVDILVHEAVPENKVITDLNVPLGDRPIEEELGVPRIRP